MILAGAQQATSPPLDEATKLQRKKEQEDKKNKLMACLTLVRSHYTGNKDYIEEFVKMHPTQTKDRLLNKMLANMMMTCSSSITNSQMTELLSFKQDPSELDYAKPENAKLIDFDIERYIPDASLSDEKKAAPIDLSQQELNMQTIVEVSENG